MKQFQKGQRFAIKNSPVNQALSFTDNSPIMQGCFNFICKPFSALDKVILIICCFCGFRQGHFICVNSITPPYNNHIIDIKKYYYYN